MKNIYFFCWLLTAAVFFSACADTKTDEPTKSRLELTVDEPIIVADGASRATFKVTYDGKDVTWTSGCIIKQRTTTLKEPWFTTAELGTFLFRAEYAGENSNEVEVSAQILEKNFRRNRVVFYVTSTGCAACPTGSKVVQEVRTKYPKQLIPLYFHVIYQTPKDPFVIAPSSWIYTWIGGVAYPTIKLDNLRFLSNASIDVDAFEPYMHDTKPVRTGLALNTHFDPATRKLTCDIKARITDIHYLGQQLNMVAWLTEDGLVSAQITPSGVNANYIHNDVTRKPLLSNNIRGVEVPMRYIASHNEFVQRVELDVPTEWNMDKAYVSAYIYHDQNGRGDTLLNVQRVAVSDSIGYDYLP